MPPPRQSQQNKTLENISVSLPSDGQGGNGGPCTHSLTPRVHFVKPKLLNLSSKSHLDGLGDAMLRGNFPRTREAWSFFFWSYVWICMAFSKSVLRPSVSGMQQACRGRFCLCPHRTQKGCALSSVFILERCQQKPG